MRGRKITHVGNPVVISDAANKFYVDASIIDALNEASLKFITDNRFHRLRNLKELKAFLDATNKIYTDSSDAHLRKSINSVSTNINYIEDFIFSKGYIKKVTLNEAATNIPLRSVAKLVGVEVSSRRNSSRFVT